MNKLRISTINSTFKYSVLKFLCYAVPFLLVLQSFPYILWIIILIIWCIHINDNYFYFSVIGGDCTTDSDCKALENSYCDIRRKDRFQCACSSSFIPVGDNTKCLPSKFLNTIHCWFDICAVLLQSALIFCFTDLWNSSGLPTYVYRGGCRLCTTNKSTNLIATSMLKWFFLGI